MAEHDIVGDNVRNTWNSATEGPRKAMKAVSDAVSSVGDKVKSFLPKPEETVYDYRNSNLKNTGPTSSPNTKASPAKTAAPKYHQGTDYVPKTGPAILKKGEAVLAPKEAAKHRAEKGKTMTKVNAMSGAQDALGGKSDKPKKEIKHIKTEKAKSGGYIHTHVHTHPEHHPDEQHVTPDQDGMMAHMMEHMGTPNPGEADADAGQSGIPAAGAAPAAGAPPAGAPPTGM